MSERIFRGWYVVAACFAIMMIGAGIGWFAFPVFIKPLEVEFGWTRTQLNGAAGVWALVTGLYSPLLGHWVDRFGARRIMIAGIVISGLSALAFGSIQSLLHLYIIIVFFAIGTASSTYLPVASIISSWFTDRRGVAMSIAMMGMGIGGFLMPNVSSLLIEHVDWRWSYRIFGIAVFAVLVPVAVFWLRDAPSSPSEGAATEEGSNPDNIPNNSENSSPDDGFTVRQAMGTLTFWGIGLADFAEGIAYVAILTNMVVFSIDAGISPGAAAFGFSLVHGMGTIGMLAAGPAADRFNRRVLISLTYGLPALLVLILFRLTSAVPLYAFAVLIGVISAGKATLWPLVLSDCFGKRSYATVMGFIMIFYMLGSAIGPPIAGYIFDTTGSYYWVFVLSIPIFLISGALMAVASKPRANSA